MIPTIDNIGIDWDSIEDGARKRKESMESCYRAILAAKEGRIERAHELIQQRKVRIPPATPSWDELEMEQRRLEESMARIFAPVDLTIKPPMKDITPERSTDEDEDNETALR